MLPVISFAYNLFGFLYHLLKKTNHENEDDCDTEQRVAEQNMQLEVEEPQNQPLEALRPDTPDIPRNAPSFLCTGIITDVDYPVILIDDRLFFDISSCALSLNLDDKITYSAYKNEFDMSVVTRILENHGTTVCVSWNDTKVEESNLRNIDHVIVAEVDYRQKQHVYLKDNDLKFSLYDVKGTMVPIAGDRLELKCVVQLDEDKPRNITGAQELKVVSYQPLRRRIKSAVVTEGTCDRRNYFDEQSLTNSFDSPVGQKVLIEAIESNQEACAWGDIKLAPTEERLVSKSLDINNTSPIESNQEACAWEDIKLAPTEERLVSKILDINNTSPIESNQEACAWGDIKLAPTEESLVSKMLDINNTSPIESNQEACAWADIKLAPTEESLVSKMLDINNTSPIESNQEACAWGDIKLAPTEESLVSKMLDTNNTSPIESNQEACAWGDIKLAPTEESLVSKMLDINKTSPIESNQEACAWGDIKLAPTEESLVSKMLDINNTSPIESNQEACAWGDIKLAPTEESLVSKMLDINNTSPIESNQEACAWGDIKLAPTEESLVSKMLDINNTSPIESNQEACAWGDIKLAPTEESLVSKMLDINNTSPIESNQEACAWGDIKLAPKEESLVSKMLDINNTSPIESNQEACAWGDIKLAPTEESLVSKMLDINNTSPIESNQEACAWGDIKLAPTEERLVSKMLDINKTSPIESNQEACAWGDIKLAPTEESLVSKMLDINNTSPIESNQEACAWGDIKLAPTEERLVSKMLDINKTSPIESNQEACAWGDIKLAPTEESLVSKMLDINNTSPIESNQEACAWGDIKLAPTEESLVSKMLDINKTSPIESNQEACAWGDIKLAPTEERLVSKMLDINNTSPIESNQEACAWGDIKLAPTEERLVSKMLDKNNTSPIESNQEACAWGDIKLAPTEESLVSKMLDINNTSPIESNQEACAWGDIKLAPTEERLVSKILEVNNTPPEGSSLLLEKEMGLEVTHPIKFDKDYFKQTIPSEGNIFVFHGNDYPTISYNTKVARMNRVRLKPRMRIVQAPRHVKTPQFTTVKLDMFPIPNRVWSAVLGDSLHVVRSSNEKVISQIKNKLPCLTQDLNINNYTDRWHNLLFIEEIHENISLRVYDQLNTRLINYQGFLGLELTGLCERRPSLVIGDRAIVQDIWDNSLIRYEGYIQAVRGDFILMKFQNQFHESYSGSEVSIEFDFSRTRYRRAHQAINLAISNLGQEILFPTTLLRRENQLPPEEINSILWFNKRLNDTQKSAVSNILLGQCRPKPYLIYGPPGTGKTITVIETILQILKLLPDSRILVATPSNSSSNLITERLIDYKESISNSFIRLVAHYLLESDKIPPVIKPYCATIDMAVEDTANSDYRVQQSFIELQRVIIGTCSTLGTLTRMALPLGHFTHIIVDEAGQVTEPEIMIPLTFTDNVNGQIILAGDPMQLGPVVTSLYASEFGMSDSYLCRLLETPPYQKNFAVFQNGFNEKMVTKLNDNYRSLKEVITLPNEMFYDGSLVPKINRSQPWIEQIVKVMNNIFDLGKSDFTGGIYVNGVRGENVRAEDSPSWYNRDEASMVAMTTSKLYESNITPDEIGIITPFIAQRRYLRILFKSLKLPEPKIGTVEEFQGQEKPLIIISTVRSSTSLLENDRKNQLNFIKNPKRLNVALTRAQVAVLLVCDPYVLCTDPLWAKVINQAVNDDKYMGCDLPNMTYTT